MLKILLVVALVAVAVYLVVRVSQGGASAWGRSVGKRGPKRPPKPPRPRMIAPDDDEDFLRDLDRRKPHGEEEDGPAGS